MWQRYHTTHKSSRSSGTNTLDDIDVDGKTNHTGGLGAAYWYAYNRTEDVEGTHRNNSAMTPQDRPTQANSIDIRLQLVLSVGRPSIKARPTMTSYRGHTELS